MDEYYRILGVDASSDVNDVKRAYRGLAKKYHPDYHPNQTKMVEINEAYSEIMKYLKDKPEVVYDKSRRTRERPNPPNTKYFPLFMLLLIGLVVYMTVILLGI